MSKQFFFVLGMPRARTAWASVFLTGRESFAFHEGIAGCVNMEAFRARLEARPEPVVGDVDALLPFHSEALFEMFPEARYGILTRFPDEALESLVAAEPGREEETRAAWPAYMERYEAAIAGLARHQIVRIDSSELDNASSAKGFYEFLTRRDFDLGAWEKLGQLRVTLDPMSRNESFLTMPPPDGPVAVKPVLSEAMTRTNDAFLALLQAVIGDDNAFAWVRQSFAVALAWDHVTDGDPVGRAELMAALQFPVLHWPENPFWIQHRESCVTAIRIAHDIWKRGGADNEMAVYSIVPKTAAVLMGRRAVWEANESRVTALIHQIYKEDNT